MSRSQFVCATAFLLLAAGVHAEPPSGFIETSIDRPDGSSWNEAVDLTFDDNGRLWVAERSGRIWIVDPSSPHGAPTEPFLDISDEVGGWRDHGLLGIALHPYFSDTGYVYLVYVVDREHLLHCTEAPGGTGFPVCGDDYDPLANAYFDASIGRITRYTAEKPDGEDDFHHAVHVDYASRKVLLGESIDSGFPILQESHGVGSILFGDDGTLLASFGDSASFRFVDRGGLVSDTYQDQAIADGILRPKEDVGALRSQLVDSLAGKVVRLDPDTGNGLPSNPYFDSSAPRAPRSRVWLMGLRNPFRMSLKPLSGDHLPEQGNPGTLIIADVGWNAREELNIAETSGINFGWPLYEGMDLQQNGDGTAYVDVPIANRDAPNPLFGINGCSQEFFSFNDLIRQDTLSTAAFPNPCDAQEAIPPSIATFSQRRPVLDWFQNDNIARWSTYNGLQPEHPLVGQPNSAGTQTVLGTPFRGNTSSGGVVYTGSSYPEDYHGSLFFADYGRQWIRNAIIDESGFPLEIRSFDNAAGGVVAIESDPQTGDIYYISWATFLTKITYQPTGNQPPVAVAASDTNFGASPKQISFDAAGSSDPENQPLTYSWDFGDGSDPSTGPTVVHTFDAGGSSITNYTVTLTVTDDQGATDETNLFVSINNTPPQIDDAIPQDGTLYSLDGLSNYMLSAAISDNESSLDALSCSWLTVLHHDNHEHSDPPDTNCSTSTTISPLGCGLETYYFSVHLTVTDPHGLATTHTSRLFPQCTDTQPTANAGPDFSVDESGTIILDGSASSDGEGPLASYQWTQISGTVALMFDGNAPTVSIEAPTVTGGQSEVYSFQLTVVDSDGNQDTDVIDVTVNSLTHSSMNVLFVVGSTPPNSADASVAARLASAGNTVTIVDDNLVSAAQGSGQDLIVISSTVTSGNVNTTFRMAPIPILTWEGYLLDDLGMTGPSLDADYGVIGGQQTVDILNPGHPLSAGFSGTIAVSNVSTNEWNWGVPGPEATVVASLAGNASRATIFGYLEGTTMPGIVAPARRISFVSGNGTATTWTPEALELFDAAIAWAVSTANQPPIVDAGPPQTVIANIPAVLDGTVLDDGASLPLTVSWSIWSSDTGGNVNFSDASDPATSVSIDSPGIYELKLEANDAEFTVSDLVAVTVIPPPSNMPPIAEAGNAQSTDVNRAITLAGSYSDDGIAGPILTTWQVIGVPPGNVFLDNFNNPNTTAIFDTAGSYTLEFAVDDSEFVDTDTVTISVNPSPTNTPPVVDAGPSQTVQVNDSVNLFGSVVDDGISLPLTAAWTVLGNAPGNATFDDSSALSTAVTFDTPGDYTLKLEVSDGEFADSDTVSIAVTTAPQPAELLFVTGRVPLNQGDARVVSTLVSMGHTLRVTDDDDVDSSDAIGMDLIVISSTVTSSKLNTLFRSAAVPLITWESYLFDDLGMTGNAEGTDYGLLSNQTSVAMAGSAHPLTAGLTGTVVISASPQPASWGAPGGSAVVAATIVDDPGLATVFGYDLDASMPGLQAPARRAGLAFGNDTAATWTPDGERLFVATVDWLLSPTVTVNTAPIVEAGPSKTVFVESGFALQGAVTDDGVALPLNIEWSVWTSDTAGTVTFDDDSNPTTTARIDTIGTYDLKLEASDPEYTVADFVTITVESPPANAPPVAEAGEPRNSAVGIAITLNGSFIDDGIAGPVTVRWSIIDGPAGAIGQFTDPASPTTSVSLDTVGTYTLEFSVDDSEFTDVDTVNITITEAPVTANVLFVAGNDPVTRGDINIVALIESLGHNVSVIDDDVVSVGDSSASNLIVISSTVVSGRVNSMFRDLPIPVIVWESYLYDDMGMTDSVPEADFGNLASQLTINIIDPTNPLSFGLVGQIPLGPSTDKLAWGRPSLAAAIAGTLADDPSKGTLFSYQPGDLMFGLLAPAIRIGLPFSDFTAEAWTSDARSILTAAVELSLNQ